MKKLLFLILLAPMAFGQLTKNPAYTTYSFEDTTAAWFMTRAMIYAYVDTMFSPSDTNQTFWSTRYRSDSLIALRIAYTDTTLTWFVTRKTADSLLNLRMLSSDSTKIRAYSSALYLKNADSTTLKNALLKNADSTTLKNALLKNADSTTLKNALLKNADSTTIRTYSNALYAVKAMEDSVDSLRVYIGNYQPGGTYLTPGDSTTVRTYSNAIYLKNADSTTLKNALLKNADSTSLRNYSSALYLKNADSTSVRTYSSALYLKNADSTTLKNALLKNADSTSVRNYSSALYLKNADSTTLKNALLKNADSTSIRNYSSALYFPKSDTANVSATNLTRGSLPVARFPNSGVSPGTYNFANVTVDQYGRVTTATSSSGSTTQYIGGYFYDTTGITATVNPVWKFNGTQFVIVEGVVIGTDSATIPYAADTDSLGSLTIGGGLTLTGSTLHADTTVVLTPSDGRQQVNDSLSALSFGTRALESPNIGAATGTSLALSGAMSSYGTSTLPFWLSHSGFNLNTSTEAQKKDSAVIYFSMTASGKPMFSMVGPTGTILAGIDSAGIGKVSKFAVGGTNTYGYTLEVYGNTYLEGNILLGGYFDANTFQIFNVEAMGLGTATPYHLLSGKGTSGICWYNSDYNKIGTSAAQEADTSAARLLYITGLGWRWIFSGETGGLDTGAVRSDYVGYAQPLDDDLTDLADGSLTPSKVPTFGAGAVGVVPASGGGTSNYLRADGNWAEPPGGAGLDSATVAALIHDSLATISAFDTTGAYDKNATTGKVYYDASDGTLKIGTDGGGSLDSAAVSGLIKDSLDANTIGVNLTPGLPVYAASAESLYTRRDTLEIFVFGAGGGNAIDTAAFTTSTYYGSFFNKSDTLTITSLKCVMAHGIGTDTLEVQVAWDDSLGGTGAVKLNTADLPINSIGTGTEDTSFDNAAIPPGVWVWMKTPVVVAGRKPTLLSATLTGYRAHK